MHDFGTDELWVTKHANDEAMRMSRKKKKKEETNTRREDGVTSPLTKRREKETARTNQGTRRKI